MIEGIIGGAIYIVVALKVRQRDRDVGFTKDIGTGRFESFDGLGVLKKNVVLKRGITPSRGGACEVKRLLHGHGHAVKRSMHLALGKVCVGPFGVGERLFSGINDDGVKFAVVLICSSQEKIE